MKKIRIFTILIMLILFTGIGFSNTSMAVEEYYYNAIVETAEAFYRRWTNGQYDDYRKDTWYTPEEGTSQHRIYSTCSYFIYKVYSQAFNNLRNKVWLNNSEYLKYAQKYYNSGDLNPKSDGIGKYILQYFGNSGEIYSDDVLGSTEESVQSYINDIGEKLRIRRYIGNKARRYRTCSYCY